MFTDLAKLPRFSAPPAGRLGADIVTAWHTSGVVVLENFFAAAAAQRLRARAREMVDSFDPTTVRSVFSTLTQTQLDDRYFIDSGDKIRFFLEADAFDAAGKLVQGKEHSLNKMGHAMHDLDPVFDAFSRTPELAEVTARLGYTDPVIIQSMYLFKPPRIGAEVVCHQDSSYIYTEPESCLGLWFALEDATIDNGCLYFLPGQHRSPLRERNRRVSGSNVLKTEVVDATPFQPGNALAAETPAGSLVIFHGRAPHFSGPNRTDQSRHAYSLHVIERHCDYPAENWLQRSPALPLRGFV